MMKILVVGISVRAMVESAVHSGYQIVALDAFGDRDLRELTEAYSLHHDFQGVYSPEALYEAGRELNADAVAYTSNLENHPQILSRFGESCRIVGNTPQVVTAVRSWAGLLEQLMHAGFPIPETIFVGDNHPADPSRRWLIKPVLSGGGNGVVFRDSATQYISGKESRFCIPGCMLQEYIPGKPCSAAFVANGKACVVLGVTEQLVGLRQFGVQDFRYCGNLLPLQETLEPGKGANILEQINGLAEFLTREYQLIGVNGIDFILNGEKVYLTEVNPRYSASMELMEMAYGLPMFDLHVRAVLDGFLPDFDLGNVLSDGLFFGKGILFADNDATALDTRSWADRGIRDIPESGEKIRKGGPICTILADGRAGGDTIAELFERTEKLKGEIYG